LSRSIDPAGRKALNDNTAKHLIVYAKRPLPGYAKTRLAKGIGPEDAAGLYARLLYAYLVDLVGAELEHTSIELSVASPEDVPFFAAAFPELVVRSQVDGDLGQRMAASLTQAFDRGAVSVVLTGSDIPGLDSTLVRAAFQTLETVPVVLGPAADGGYYMIGTRAPNVPLFEGIAWSTERVLEQTTVLARAQGLEVAYLPQLYDVDTIVEYERWRAARSANRKL
jgi:rSAM/selenodomain-associated transferase 1